MIDIVNVQLYGFPVFMYAMILVTTGAMTYATVYPNQMPSIGSLPSLPSANPSGVSSIPGVPNMGVPPAPPTTPGPQGGKHTSKKTKRRHSPKKSHHSAKNVKKNIKIH